MKTTKLALLTPLLFLVVACGAGASGANDSAAPGSAGGGTATGVSGASGSSGSEVGVPAPGGVPTSGKVDLALRSNTAKSAASTALMQRAVISKGSLQMQSKNVAAARDRVFALVKRWGGTIANEQSVTSNKGTMAASDLDLRVPSGDFDTAMQALPKVARTLHTDRSSQDVTTQVIDTDARVRAQQKSVRRIEVLLANARNLGQIIAIESDLADRQATLDSLKSQQAYLTDQTSLSSIHVSITRRAQVPPPVRHHHAATGLGAGLDTGFTALKTVTVGALTVVGVAVPFAIVVLILAVPLLLLWRRRRPAAAATTPTPAEG